VDKYGNDVPGMKDEVHFAVTSGGGHLSDKWVYESDISEVAQVSVIWTLGPEPGIQTVEVSAPRFKGSPQQAEIYASDFYLTGVAPDTLYEGHTITLLGNGFGPVPADNTVTIGEEQLDVVGGGPNSLDVVIPRHCRPVTSTLAYVARGGEYTDSMVVLVGAEPSVALAVGQQLLVPNPASACVSFPASAEREEYLVGIQSLSEEIGSYTSVNAVLRGPQDPYWSPPAAPVQRAPGARQVAQDARSGLRTAHRRAEAELRQRERNQIDPMIRAGQLASRAVRPSLVETPNPGDTLTLRFPDIAGEDLCEYVELRAVAREVGERGIWLEDIANLSDGFTAEDFAAFAAQFDQTIYPTAADYFGAPGDMDGNGRIAVLVTREVNRLGGVLGFMTTADLVARSACASSDEGEIMYVRAPDRFGNQGDPYPVEYLRQDMPVIVTHELTHIVQSTQRMAAGRPHMARWMAEGQATLAEEVIGHAFLGNEPGQNYGYPTAFYVPAYPEPQWYANAFWDIAYYFGYVNDETRAQWAPENCSWWGLPPGDWHTCADVYRLPYGVSWSLLRWLSDQYGWRFTGGEAELQRRLIEANSTGLASLAEAVGTPADSLMAQWAAALYLDDRRDTYDPIRSFSSWDLSGIMSRMASTATLEPRTRHFADQTEIFHVRAGSTGYILLMDYERPATTLQLVPGEFVDAVPDYVRLWLVRTR
jgi:hypothetical protein